MASRAAYRTKKDGEIGVYLRKQNYAGRSKQDMRAWVKAVARNLSSGKEVGDGAQALRHDLNISRLNSALIRSLLDPPFDEVHKNKAPDISQNGIFEIEVVEWNRWKVNHVPVDRINGEGEHIEEERQMEVAEITFEENKKLPDAANFEWKLDEDKIPYRG